MPFPAGHPPGRTPKLTPTQPLTWRINLKARAQAPEWARHSTDGQYHVSCENKGAGAMADTQSLLGNEAEDLLTHTCHTIPKEDLVLPGGDFVDRVVAVSDRSPRVLRNLQAVFENGRLAGTGYLSILPVDQGVEHSAASAFAPNTRFLDPANIVELALDGGCNAVASTIGVLGAVSRRYAHRIPFVVKLNHNELLTYPNRYDQIMFGTVEQCFDLGAAGVGATVYFGSEESDRQLREVSEVFARAHELGMFTVLWCYLRNSAFKQDGVDYSLSADLTGQANHLGATI
ncbi:MAG TPA: class I fructose-bisphosphate aldolase, partial [Jiangellales bacterium]|nr:class I fructose-bisphosphate aldolase [Jiangellales bacterium]